MMESLQYHLTSFLFEWYSKCMYLSGFTDGLLKYLEALKYAISAAVFEKKKVKHLVIRK